MSLIRAFPGSIADYTEPLPVGQGRWGHGVHVTQGVPSSVRPTMDARIQDD